MVIRLARRQSLFKADKNHFSHRLVDMGLSQRNAVLTVHLITLMTGLGGVLLFHVDNWMAALLIVALITCILAVIAILETVARPTPAETPVSLSSVSERDEEPHA